MQLACSPAVQKSAFYEPLRVSRVMDCSLHLTPGAGRDSSQKQLRKLMIRWSEIQSYQFGRQVLSVCHIQLSWQSTSTRDYFFLNRQELQLLM